MRTTLVIIVVILALSVPAYAQQSTAQPVCDFSNYPQSFTCALPTPTPQPTATAVPATSTPVPTATATPVVVAGALSVGTNHVQPYTMPATWTESIDAYIVSDTVRRVNVLLLVQDGAGQQQWSASLNTALSIGSTNVEAGWTIPATQPPATYYASIVVTDPVIGPDFPLVPMMTLFNFQTTGPPP